MWLAAALAVSGDSPREEVEDLGRGGRVVLEEPDAVSQLAHLPTSPPRLTSTHALSGTDWESS